MHRFHNLNKCISVLSVAILAALLLFAGYHYQMVAAAEDSQNSLTERADSAPVDLTALETPKDSQPDALNTENPNSQPVITLPQVTFDPNNAFTYCSQPICEVTDEAELHYQLTFDEVIPRTDDDQIYLFEVAAYEDEMNLRDLEPIAAEEKSSEVTFTLPFEQRYLFSRFVPAVRYWGSYVPLYFGQHLNNPEALAPNTTPYPNLPSKKGILLDGTTLGTDYFLDLNVKRVVYNIPLSMILGETDDPDHPTIEYEYNGEAYHFNGYKCWVYDSLFSYLTAAGYHTTAIILNDWNEAYPEMIHPQSRNRTYRSLYYAFNTEEESGVRLMEAAALFLAERYAGGEHGMVHDWVIANEINQQNVWNYMATNDVDYYTEAFEKSFRIFYNAIRSQYSNALVYYSLDHDWNNNHGNNSHHFNGRDILYAFNELAEHHGSYDWGLSIHPYPAPLTKTAFWNGNFDHSEEAPIVTPMNLSAITNVLTKSEFLDSNYNVRPISVTELGFSSGAGQQLQAAAYAYCYYIIDSNDYINCFLLNRQTDDADSLKSGLALGIYNSDYSAKPLKEVFRNIDTDEGQSYIPEMLTIIGEDTLEDALNRAK